MKVMLSVFGFIGLIFVLCFGEVRSARAAGSGARGVVCKIIYLKGNQPGETRADAIYAGVIPGYSCYRTISEINQQLIEWENMYPDLANVMTIGYSYEARPLQVMRLTNTLTGEDKPVFFLMANIHGNELITNEVAMVFIQYLLENYTRDPDVTWLLDEHDIYVMVSANPDGHIKNESGEPWARWRKNTNPSNDDCDGDHYGIDLNRNFSFKWGGSGSQSDPCGINYRGPSPVSEYETQAIQEFMLTLFPDQRGPADSDAAPDDATGIFISLHSYGNLVIWPWGYTRVETSNAPQLQRLGQKLAAFTGYTPQQAYYLYPTNGTTKDWSYGELGIASYVFEIGSKAEGHYPPCSHYDALVQPNIQALLYAAKVARTPYLTSFGPDVLGVTSVPTWTLRGRYVEISATIAAADVVSPVGRSMLYSQTIGVAEAYIDIPPWKGGVSYPLEVTDGAFDDFRESVWGRLPLAMNEGITSGRRLIFVRGRNAAGDWGPVSADFITVSFSSLMPAAATQSGAPGTSVPYALTLTNMDQVSHTFFINRSASRWSTTVVPTRVRNLSPSSQITVVVTVAIPAEGISSLLFSSDVVTITAVGEDDPVSSSATSVLTTQLYVEYHALLPLVMRMPDADTHFLSNVDVSLSFWEEGQ